MPTSNWEKRIGNIKITTFGLKERLGDFPELMEEIRQTLTTLIEECEPDLIIIKREKPYWGNWECESYEYNSGIQEYKENLLKAIK